MIDTEELLHKLAHLKPQIEEFGTTIQIDTLRQELQTLDDLAAQPDFWNKGSDETQKVLQDAKKIRRKIQQYETLADGWQNAQELVLLGQEMKDDSVLAEMQTEIATLQQELETATLSTLLTGEYDANNAILTLHAGAGGVDAQDWTAMLYRMYTRWTERHGYQHQVLDYLDGEEAGIKSATLLVSGDNAYGFLKAEAGVHRLVRISPFDSSGKRHTSFASVEVMPEIDSDTEVQIDEKDLRIDTYRSSGAGGQHVNKTESAVRITHLPTGIAVACQNERSQRQNRDIAMKLLLAKLAEIKEREHLENIADIKGEHKDNAWGSQIRSYVFMPYTMAKDHRTGHEEGNISAVMDGEIDGFMNSYLQQNH